MSGRLRVLVSAYACEPDRGSREGPMGTTGKSVISCLARCTAARRPAAKSTDYFAGSAFTYFGAVTGGGGGLSATVKPSFTTSSCRAKV